jgi:hypothetical protein
MPDAFVWADPITSSGVPFARAIEVQILDGRNSEVATSHGDLFAIHGATFKPDRPHPKGWMRCLPSEQRAKPAGEWNHYRVLCSDGVVKLAGEWKGRFLADTSRSRARVTSASNRKVPSATSATSESKSFRPRIPKPDEIAPLAEGFKSLYTGNRSERLETGRWDIRDTGRRKIGFLNTTARARRRKSICGPKRSTGDFVLVCDWRWTEKGTKAKCGQSFCRRANTRPTSKESRRRWKCLMLATAESICAVAARAR